MANALGIDVSFWQDDNSTPQQMDFLKAFAAGAAFVFVKASQSTWLDSDFLYNWKSAQQSGLLRGAYHYMDWTRPAIEQARFFAGLLKQDPGELPPVLDFECRKDVPYPGTTRQACKDFLIELKALTGRTPILYTSPGYWAEYGSGDPYWAQYPLWIAHYETKTPIIPRPWQIWTFWQYTPKGDGLKFGAESKQIDMDLFAGTLESLRQFATTPVQPPTPKPTWSQAMTAWARTHGYNGPDPEAM